LTFLKGILFIIDATIHGTHFNRGQSTHLPDS